MLLQALGFATNIPNVHEPAMAYITLNLLPITSAASVAVQLVENFGDSDPSIHDHDYEYDDYY